MDLSRFVRIKLKHSMCPLAETTRKPNTHCNLSVIQAIQFFVMRNRKPNAKKKKYIAIAILNCERRVNIVQIHISNSSFSSFVTFRFLSLFDIMFVCSSFNLQKKKKYFFFTSVVCILVFFCDRVSIFHERVCKVTLN